MNGTTILEIFDGDERIKDVTVYHLLHMKSGMVDYDDGVLRQWTWDNPDGDILPLDFLRMIDHHAWYCSPGDCADYSSIGYTLLGLVLAQHAGVSSWEEYDQMSIIPEELRYKYNSTLFTGKGKCS